jgi:hypothetical protein
VASVRSRAPFRIGWSAWVLIVVVLLVVAAAMALLEL